MPKKKIVVCCDGTWNTPRTNTNIYRTFTYLQQALVQPQPVTRGEGARTCHGTTPAGEPVALFYDQGVGSNWYDRLPGGVAGLGLSDNVRDAYHFLAHEYEPGAEIFLFGFSRGAYTARSLGGFIQAAGLLARPSEMDVARAYLDYYATEDRVIHQKPGWSLGQARDWLVGSLGNLIGTRLGSNLQGAPRHQQVRVRFLGVYDTVGALGVPIPQAQPINDAIVGFHNSVMSPLIEHAVQALAVDERRGPYVPSLWTLDPGKPLDPGQTVLQVWFPGVHSDIGGGYEDKGIGNYTLDFMLRQAVRHGLPLDLTRLVPSLTLDHLPPQHESLNGVWRTLSEKLTILPEGTRVIGTTVRHAQGETVPVAGEVRFHPMLAERFGQRVDVILDEETGAHRHQVYRPANVVTGQLPLWSPPLQGS